MTREEAITVLKAFMENPLFSEVHKAVFNIAIHDIKAYQDWNINNLILVNKDNYEPLEQEPCEDCISRKAVLDKIKEVCFSREQEWVDFRVSQGSNGQRDLIINFIKDLPSVQPKPKTEVLDRIRAEIDQYLEIEGFGSEYRNDVKGIIDKYKAESEE